MKPLTIIPLRVGQMATNCYVVSDAETGDALIVDPGDDAEYIIDTVASNHVHPVAMVATHGHFDHIMAAFALQLAYTIPCYINGLDALLVARMVKTAKHFLGVPIVDPPPRVRKGLADSDHIRLGKTYIKVMATPGHTPGGISLYHKRSACIWVGDTMFADGTVGRTDHDYSSVIDLNHSIRNILKLPGETRIFPGHGEETTVELAKQYFKV